MRTSVRWLPALFIIIIISALSSISDLAFFDLTSFPLWFKQLIDRYTVRLGHDGFFSYTISLYPDYVLHKLGHITLFGLLGTVLYYATRGASILSISFVFIFAMLDEWHQYFVPGRSSRFGDVVIDTLSATLFIMVIRRLARNRT